MNKENLKRVRDAIAKHPKNFDLSEWYRSRGQSPASPQEYKAARRQLNKLLDADNYKCKTTGCIAGWCCALISKDDFDHKLKSGLHVEDIGKDFLELTTQEEDSLFFRSSTFWQTVAPEYAESIGAQFVWADEGDYPTPSAETVVMVLDWILDDKISLELPF